MKGLLILPGLYFLYNYQFLSLCLIMLIIIVKPIRFYVMSFFFPWLYEHRNVAKFLGIRFEDDRYWHTNREETQIYMSGVFATMFTIFTGMKIETNLDTRKELMYLQGAFGKNITMEPYFDKINGKKLTLNEFEDFLSSCLLVETNRVFEILDSTQEAYFSQHLKIVRTIVNGLTGGVKGSIKTMIVNWKSVKEIIKIMKSVSEAKRLLLFVPHLSLIDGFSKMLSRTKGDMTNLQASDFFDFTSKFFVLVNKGQLVFIDRHQDSTNSANNRTFGPKGFVCPGSLYVMKFIKSIFEFLKVMDITVEGTANISNKRFRNITNKNEIFITFKKSDRNYVNDNTDFGEKRGDVIVSS